MSDLKKQFGHNLRQIRLRQQITQQDLANQIQLSVGYISNLERGISAPSFAVIELLATALEVNVAEFFVSVSEKTVINRKRGRRSN